MTEISEVNLSDVKQLVAKARGKWLLEHASEELITQKVHQILNEELLTIITKFLKVDTLLSNDYYQSPTTRFLKEKILKAIETWGQEQLHKDVELDQNLKDKVITLYNKALVEGIMRNIGKVAEEKSHTVLSEIVEQITLA